MTLPLFFALYCLEAGFFFTVVPWTPLWALNPWLHASPAVALLADNPFARGFISGFGIVHLIIGTHELIRLSRQRRGSAAQ